MLTVACAHIRNQTKEPLIILNRFSRKIKTLFEEGNYTPAIPTQPHRIPLHFSGVLCRNKGRIFKYTVIHELKNNKRKLTITARFPYMISQPKDTVAETINFICRSGCLSDEFKYEMVSCDNGEISIKATLDLPND